jgi:hypothetical protein
MTLRETLDAGVVDQDVDAALLRQHGLRSAIDGVAVGHVERIDRGRHEASLCGVETVDVAIPDDDARAAGSQPARNAKTDAAHAAGDDGHLPLQASDRRFAHNSAPCACSAWRTSASGAGSAPRCSAADTPAAWPLANAVPITRIEP